MILKIISEKENPLYTRKEIVVDVKKETSPKESEAIVALSEKFSASLESIKIERIISKFGSDIFTIHAKIYNSKEDKESIEPKKKEGKPTA